MKYAIIKMSLLALVVTSCTSTVSEGVQKDGTVRGSVIFPDKTQATLEEGTYPNVTNLSSIHAGMTRNQLFDLIGHPHFREMFKAREWDYLFNFRNSDESVKTCQFKVIFDSAYRAQSFFWKPKDCEQKKSEEVKRNIKVHYSTDALFTFNQGGVVDILPEGRAMLDKLARKIIDQGNNTWLSVTGYTDRLGSEEYNLHLSQIRANAVAKYLANKGVAVKLLSTKGLGEIKPKVTCSNQNRRQLITCLAPNRRVEIESW